MLAYVFYCHSVCMTFPYTECYVANWWVNVRKEHDQIIIQNKLWLSFLFNLRLLYAFLHCDIIVFKILIFLNIVMQ